MFYSSGELPLFFAFEKFCYRVIAGIPAIVLLSWSGSRDCYYIPILTAWYVGRQNVTTTSTTGQIA